MNKNKFEWDGTTKPTPKKPYQILLSEFDRLIELDNEVFDMEELLERPVFADENKLFKVVADFYEHFKDIYEKQQPEIDISMF